MKRNLIFMVACLLIGASSYAQQPKYGTYYEQRASLFENLPVTSSDIIFLRNSITDGCEWSELFQNPHIKNRGISGDVSMGVYDRLDAILKGKPAKIFLMIGINDVSHDLSADSIVGMIKQIVDKVKTDSPPTKLYVQSILPVNDEFTRFPKVHNKTQVILDINKGLKLLTKEKHCTFIDLYPHFTAPGTQSLDKKYTNDGLHLMGAGYLQWKKFLTVYLK